MIQVSDLRFQYRSSKFQLRIPELSISRGEKVAIIGPSGSGKTTLLMLLAGASPLQHGSIRVDDTQVDRLTEAERRRFRISRIGIVFQGFELLEYLTVLENILLPFRINRSLPLSAESKARAISLAKSTGLSEKLERHPNRLSQGERQRVALCRALIARPTVVLADEPTGSLDPQTTQDALDLLFAQVQQESATLLFVTHDHSLLDQFDRTIDLSNFQAPSRGA